MQTINGSDLPEVPTHSHSENESKANKRTRNQVIKEQRVEKLANKSSCKLEKAGKGAAAVKY